MPATRELRPFRDFPVVAVVPAVRREARRILCGAARSADRAPMPFLSRFAG
jgi:hypothetical protein